MSSKLRIALLHSAIGAAIIAAPVLGVSAGPAYAGTITLTDSWTEGTPANVTNTGSGPPTLTMSTTNTSNDGTVTPQCNSPCLSSHAYTQPSAWSATGTSVTDYLFVADPNNNQNGLYKASIPISITLSDGKGGTITFTDYINYFAQQSSDTDSMAWYTSAVSSPGYVSGTNNGSPSLVQTETLSDGVQIKVTLPYEKDWNMAQEITFYYVGGGGGGGGGGSTVPEPSPLAVMGLGLVGLALLRWRPVAKSTRSS